MKGLRKKNNKGFSLVELIVVVLIIGILGVALAPNIMKWVNNARENSDKNNKASVESSVNAAVADYLSNPGYKIEKAVEFTINKTLAWKSGHEGWSGDSNAQFTTFKDCIEAVFNNKYPTTQKVSGGFTVKISVTGEVEVSYPAS